MESNTAVSKALGQTSQRQNTPQGREEIAKILCDKLYKYIAKLDYSTKGIIEIPTGTVGSTQRKEVKGHPDPYEALVAYLHGFKGFSQNLAAEKLVRPVFWYCSDKKILVPHQRIDSPKLLWTFNASPYKLEGSMEVCNKYQPYLLSNIEACFSGQNL